MMEAAASYQWNLSQPRQRGQGAHSYVWKMARLGKEAGFNEDQIFSDIRRVLDHRVSDKEIDTAIGTAEHHTGTPRPTAHPVFKDAAATLRNILAQAPTGDEADIHDASPIRLHDEPKYDAVLLLKTLFKRTERLFIGGPYDTENKTAEDWITLSENGVELGPHMITNALSGTPAPKKSGDGQTLRGDFNVTTYRHCVVEFDSLPRTDQLRFWAAVKLPIVALIDSGGKSIHAWVDVQKLAQVETFDQWTTNIKQRLYEKILTPLGVDPQCSNPARLSRLPGHYRTEKQAYQRLLWLSPEGKPICS
jgi:hypothetical protein